MGISGNPCLFKQQQYIVRYVWASWNLVDPWTRFNRGDNVYVRRLLNVWTQQLVGGLNYFLFSHVLGISIPIDSYFSEGFKPQNQISDFQFSLDSFVHFPWSYVCDIISDSSFWRAWKTWRFHCPAFLGMRLLLWVLEHMRKWKIPPAHPVILVRKLGSFWQVTAIPNTAVGFT